MRFNFIASELIKDKTVSCYEYIGKAKSYILLAVGNMRLLAVVTLDESDTNPLIVNYKEKYYANGKIPSGFSKRENGSNNYEILIGRIIDRAIRPLISSHICVNLTCTLLSHDRHIDIKSWAVWLAGVAIARAGVKIQGPVAANTISLDKGSCFIAAIPDGISSVELKSEPISDVEIRNHIIQKVDFDGLWKFATKLATFYVPPEATSEMINTVIKDCKRLSDFKQNWAGFVKLYGNEPALFNKISSAYAAAYMPRAENRRFLECRQIECSVGLLPMAHGSAMFSRGNTSVLASAVSSDNPKDCVINDSPSKYNKDYFFVHYDFPGYCTGDTNKRHLSRREIGHGMLVQNGLKHALEQDLRPIRLVTDVISSDGSSSMAAACAGSLALYNAGKIKSLVGGISIGSFHNQLLVDLTESEDQVSNMDFKVIANNTGITAIQMDTKSLISLDKFFKALKLAFQEINDNILCKMNNAINNN